MKDYCLELVSARSGASAKFNIMREYLQAYILRILQDQGILRNWIFLGGTALRFLYDLPRYSEDLDFSLNKTPKTSFLDLMKRVKEELILAGYSPDMTTKTVKTVQSTFIRFSGLMYEAGISPLKGQKFAVKLELDTNPPSGAELTTKIVNKFFPLSFLAYDLPSFLAGKLAALLNRKYTKGRDYYDLGWFLTRFKDVSPNILLLQNAIRQTGWQGDDPNQNNWREFLYSKVEKTDWQKVNDDVVRFLENPKDMQVFTKENILRMIKGELH